MRKIIIFIFGVSLLSCAKEPTVSLTGNWIMEETVYSFHSELTITEEDVSTNYCYYVSNDTIYLDYGLPFKIELLTDQELVLSKNDGLNYYLYEFNRIDG